MIYCIDTCFGLPLESGLSERKVLNPASAASTRILISSSLSTSPVEPNQPPFVDGRGDLGAEETNDINEECLLNF